MKAARVILLFLVFSLLPLAAAQTVSAQNQGGEQVADLSLLLNSFAALGEGHVESVLRGLRLISVTEEARSGEWERMRGLLVEFDRSGIKAAAIWFVLPDGSYYSLAKGLTGHSLRDREYFPTLMAGEEITGALVLSKSTGKRTTIVAVPIRKNGEIIGALGASLSVEEISRMLDEKMGLPGNIIFYALDQKGQTSLHKVSAMLFAYPSDMGSRSLAETVDEMLASPEGVVTYDFYGERVAVFKKHPLTGWVYVIGMITGRPGQQVAELPPILSELERDITAELNRMDHDLGRLAEEISEENLKTAETRKMLGDFCRSYPYVVDCSVVDRNGIMVLVEPEEYAKFEGSDISTQEQVIRLQESKKPVLSKVIKAVEGFDAVDLEHPLFFPTGELAGSISVLFRPDTLLAAIISPVVQGLPVDVWLMQKDGRILYDPDATEVGRMLFNDSIYESYPQLLALGTLIANEKSGTGRYEYLGRGLQKPVMKDAYWTTVGLHGTEWRFVVIHVRAGHSLSPGKDRGKPGKVSNADALRTLAKDPEITKALSGNDVGRLLSLFMDFYLEQEGLYAVQWLDRQGINRYGYPEEDSLINFDMKSSRTPSSKRMIEVLTEKKESSFESPLVEGKTGTFFMVPVYEGGEYLGMLYTIRLKE